MGRLLFAPLGEPFTFWPYPVIALAVSLGLWAAGHVVEPAEIEA